MRPYFNLQRTMSSHQFSMQVFVVITITALASVASSVCFDQEAGSSDDFKFICSQIEKIYKIRIICYNNDWTKWPDVKLNLPPADAIAEIQFDYCNFPATVNVQNILNTMKLPVIHKTEFKHLNGMLDRKSLKGLSITEFQLGYGDFQELPFDLMYDVMNVSSFVSYNNELIDIPDSFFGDWAQNLTQVILKSNKLRKIKRNDFSRLVNLTTLDLAYNEITEIEPAAFSELVHLEKIDLSFNRLRTLPVGVFQQTNTLNLAHNEIIEIEPAAFDNLLHLESIDLSFNRLRTLPIGLFQRNIRLKSIHLGSNCFDELAQDLLANTNRLEDFSMDANNGTLSTLPDMLFGNLNDLESVSLQSNKLKSLPSNLFTGCSKITSIHLEDNELTTLPSGLFNDTRELQYLRISENRLETLPPHIFSKLNRLERLFLDTNRLTSLTPEVLESLQSVLEFNASNNNITRMDDRFFHYLKSVYLIDLSHNQITFEGHQHGGVKLQDTNESSLINTSKNEDMPVVVDGIPIYTRDLNLKFNNIKELNADVTKFLKYVHYLDLSSNRISQINLSVLPVEYMMWNSTLDGKVQTRYKSINLYGNLFHCDCNMKDFIDQLNGENGTELRRMLPGYDYICASPPEMKGRYLKLLSPDQLNCLPNASDQSRVHKIE